MKNNIYKCKLFYQTDVYPVVDIEDVEMTDGDEDEPMSDDGGGGGGGGGGISSSVQSSALSMSCI